MSRFPSFAFRVAACGVLVLGFAATSSAQQQPVYRWVDKNGVVHYSDQPPADKQGAESVKIRSGKPAKLTPEEIAAEAAAKEKMREGIPPTQEEIENARRIAAATRAANCKTARSNLKSLNDPNTPVTAQFNGIVRALTPEERAVQIEKNTKVVERDCGPAEPEAS